MQVQTTSITRYLQALKRQGVDVSFRKLGQVQLDQAIVSFTFDDAPASAFAVGGSVLARYGYGGTFYIALSFLNDPNPELQFTLPQLQAALAQGHELGCHTYGHTDLGKTPLQTSITDIEQNQTQIQALLPAVQFQNFSYPFGAQTRPIKKYLSSRFRSARGIQHGINRQTVDFNNLKAVRLYEQHYSLNTIINVLDQAVETRGWLVFYTHDIGPHPSPYGCTPDYFESVVAACAARAVSVQTINQALNQLQLTSAQILHLSY